MDDVLSRGQHDRRRVRRAIGRLIVAARDGGLSDAKMIVVLETAVEELDEGLSAT
jgi:hypothetical protein